MFESQLFELEREGFESQSFASEALACDGFGRDGFESARSRRSRHRHFATGELRRTPEEDGTLTTVITALEQTWPPFVLVTGLLLIGHVAGEDGLFDYAAERLERLPGSTAALFAASCLDGLALPRCLASTSARISR